MRSFAGFTPAFFIGQVYAQPIKIAGLAGMSVPLLFPWLIYGAGTAVPNILVNIDMTTRQVATPVGALRSVYIDNMASSNPIYIIFPDTNYVVVAKPNSAGWFPVYTGGMKCQVAGAGFLDGNIPITNIIFSNIPVPPNVDDEIEADIALWLASSTITRGSTIYNTNLGTPALGDQTVTYSDLISAAGVFRDNLFGSPLASGFIYLTHIYVGVQVTASAGSDCGWLLESTGAAGTIYSFNQAGFSAAIPLGTYLALSGMNIKLDATQDYRLRVNISSLNRVYVTNTFNWTTNPS